MKLIRIFLFIILTLPSLLLAQANTNCYGKDYVEVSNVTYKGDNYSIVYMLRSGDRIRAKYFAAKSNSGDTVYERYRKWNNANQGIVLVSSGTYWNDDYIPDGLTIDNGVIVNNTIMKGKMDALTIVYATGGIVVSNLKDGNLKLSGGGVRSNREFDLRGNSKDLYDFINWAKKVEATVFQTHLLAYDNNLKISSYDSNPKERERRFLAVGKNEDGDIIHLIVHRPKYASLYDSARKTKDFLNDFVDMNVIFMINLDTGNQDVFELRNWNCSVNKSIKGKKPLDKAANLLVYYFK